MKKIEFFKVEGDRINRIRKHCPKCGPGVFLAEHKNRFSCGRCGYTEFKSTGKKEVKPQTQQVEEKPVVQGESVEVQSEMEETKIESEMQQSESDESAKDKKTGSDMEKPV